MSAEQRIQSLGIRLSTGSGPAGHYATTVQSGDLLFVSGKAPGPVDGRLPRGRVGSDYSTAQGRELARAACIDLLATLQQALGSLDRVQRVVELHGAICTTADFEDHASVLDGASDLLVDLFGAQGLHARSVIGVLSLRGGVPLTLRATVEVVRSHDDGACFRDPEGSERRAARHAPD